MIGLEQIVAAQFMLADMKVQCQMKTTPEIKVSASGLDTVIDNSKSISDLNVFQPFVYSPYQKEVQTHIEGLMDGEIGITGNFQFATETYPAQNQLCLYVNKVNVKVALDPKIYIAREYPKGSCRYNAVLGHEQKHIAVDRKIVNKYANIIVKAIDNTLKKVGYGHGPYGVSQLSALQKKIGAAVESVIHQYGEKMNRERDALQRQIDTLEEYKRVDAVCANK
jgi:hypothetical protein